MSLRFPLRDRMLETELPAFIMGILNATPDSFWEESRSGGSERHVAYGIEKALKLAESGADIIDIGGESSRPGSAYVSEEEELSRVIPIIEGIRKESPVPISVDTRKSAVLAAAVNAGADMLNDISALTDDPDIVRVAAKSGVPVVLMHMQGSPKTMQDNPVYDHVVDEVLAWLLERAERAEEAGIPRDKIILDPGIGFGKRHEDNLALIAGTGKLARTGYPVMMALSRKSSIGIITGRDAAGRLSGTLAANLLAVQRGATWLRVHDPAETKDSLAVLKEIERFGHA